MKRVIILLMIIMSFSVIGHAESNSILIPSACENADGQIVVDIKLSENAIQAGSFSLIYDNELLDAVSITKGDALKGCTSFTNVNYKENAVRVNWFTNNASTNSGTIYTIVFNVLTEERIETAFDISDFEFLDYNVKIVDCKMKSEPIYLNGVFFDTLFSRNGETLIDTLGTSPVELTAKVYNAVGEIKNFDVFVAEYKSDNSIYDIIKLDFSLDVAEIETQSRTIPVDGNVSYIKVFLFEKNLFKPCCIPHFIGN